jgi:ABC transporter transmembrane region
MFYLVSFFDEDTNSVSDHHSLIPIHILIALQTGALTAQLSDNPQKVNGLAGITLGTIVQSVSCLIAGSVLGLAFIWRVALVGMCTLTAVFKICMSS